MKQKTIFAILNFAMFSLIGLFFWNGINKKIKIEKLKKNIKTIDYQLAKNENILKDIVEIENNFFQKRDTLITKFSFGQNIFSVVEEVKSLAEEYKIKLKNIKINSKNSFSSVDELINNKEIPLKRHTLSFQLSGEFISIGKFLENQNIKSENIFLSQCEFNMDSLDPRGVVAQLEYKIYGDLE